MKTISEVDAKAMAGKNAVKVILEAFASGDQLTDPIYMRIHYVNTRPGQEFYQKEPFVLVPIDYLVEKLTYACFMSAALDSDLALEISGSKWLTEQLDAVCKEMVPILAGRYGRQVEEAEVEDVYDNQEIQALGREVIQKLLGKDIPDGVNIQLIPLRSAEELEQILRGTGSQGGPRCDCPDCAGRR